MEEGGDVGLLGLSVQSLLPSEVVHPRLKEDTGGGKGRGEESLLLFTSQLIMLLCISARVQPASVPVFPEC